MTLPAPRILPCGDRAVLLDCDSLADATAWFEALADLDPVLGAKSVLLRGKPQQLRSLIATRHPTSPTAQAPTDPIVIPVIYDGPDLAEVAGLTQLSVREVVAAHTRMPWTVGFTGFAPGFAYLVDGNTSADAEDPPRLQVPRRATPRASVPAGSVGLAGAFSGIYPRASPGGWQLIGRTDLDLFDVRRDPPALLVTGMRVQFQEVR